MWFFSPFNRTVLQQSSDLSISVNLSNNEFDHWSSFLFSELNFFLFILVDLIEIECRNAYFNRRVELIEEINDFVAWKYFALTDSTSMSPSRLMFKVRAVFFLLIHKSRERETCNENEVWSLLLPLIMIFFRVLFRKKTCSILSIGETWGE